MVFPQSDGTERLSFPEPEDHRGLGFAPAGVR
jgi:hypothetical protein